MNKNKKPPILIEPAHHIPFSKEEILSKFVSQLDGEDKDNASKFFMLIKNQIHLDFHQTIEALDQSYEPFNPNLVRDLESNTADSTAFSEHLKYALSKANYKALEEHDLNLALEAASLFKIRLHVDFSDYHQTVLYTRGESVRKEEVYLLFGRFFKREIEFSNYDSVVMFLHLKDEIIDATLQESCVPGSVVLKMFHNVPKADLEMLFPNTKIRMRLKDKLMIGIPALISGIVVAVTKLGASFIIMGALIGFWLGFNDEPVTLNKTNLLVIMAGLGTIAGYLWKQFSGFNRKRLKFFYLLQNSSPLSAQELDTGLEQWIEKTWACSIDFDVDDALEKLQRLGLVEQDDSQFTAVKLTDSIKRLDQRWDNYFTA